MKAMLYVTIAVTQGSGKWAEREIDIDFVPQPGMQFDCYAWTQKRKAEDVIYNTATGTFLVDCGVIETANRVEQAGVLQAHRDDGWKISTDSEVYVRRSATTGPERETAASGARPAASNSDGVSAGWMNRH